MTAITLYPLDKTKLLTHISFAVIFASIIPAINPDFPLYFSERIRFVTYLALAGMALVYIHTLVLYPILILEKNRRKYRLYLFGVLFLYLLVGIHLGLLLLTREGQGKNDFLLVRSFAPLDSEQAIWIFLFPLFFLLPITFLSHIYSLLIYREKVLLKLLEFIGNVIVVFLLFVLLAIVDGGVMFMILAIILAVFYCNAFYATPLLIDEKNIKKYLLVLLALCSCYYISSITYGWNVGAVGRGERFVAFLFILTGVLFISLVLSFIYGYIRLRLKAKEQLLNLKIGAKESELKLLKSQVNPHFLFNALNTLYASSIQENASKTADSITQLANLIRYMQEDINKDFISLERETKYLQDYIKIQEARCAIPPHVELKFEHIDDYQISPGIFIPFVENAFKYGVNPKGESELLVSVVCQENTIHFECSNTYDANFEVFHREQGFGIGIKNVKERLQLVYPDKHSIDIDKRDDMFIVNIKINTSNT
ncbi:histidine kinase [Fulvivirgaceae bacterium BMA10]|uniref:Histidine kinase n=1 Tax=Splendidivirga corallicola TaxID=3051826 RepID=A0ABT8KV22_9BACT|nr:histidine kinase [Fulvivirgaceae bacterium BMA10]